MMFVFAFNDYASAEGFDEAWRLMHIDRWCQCVSFSKAPKVRV